MHVLCEKPIAMTLAQALEMAGAADAAGVRHMTAFTYRFVPAMRFMHRLVRGGVRRRAVALPGAALSGLGPQVSGVAAARRRCRDRRDRRHAVAPDRLRAPAGGAHRPRDGIDTPLPRHAEDAAGVEHPSDLEDWVACIAEFQAGTTGAFESTKVATGYGEGGRSRDRVELNGPDGSLIYELERPLLLLGARRGGTLAEMPVPRDLLTYYGRTTPRGCRSAAGVSLGSERRVHRRDPGGAARSAVVPRRRPSAGGDRGDRDICRGGAEGRGGVCLTRTGARGRGFKPGSPRPHTSSSPLGSGGPSPHRAATATIAHPFGDPLLNAWTLAWGADRIRHGFSDFWTGLFFYPYPDTIAYSEHLLGIAIFTAPVQWLTGEPDPRVQPCDDRLHGARGRRHVPAGARVDRPRRRGVHRRRRVRVLAVPRTAVVPPAGARVGMDAGRLVRLAPVPGDAVRRAPWRCSSSRSCSRHTRTATSSTSLRSPRPRSSCTACGAAGTTSLGCCRGLVCRALSPLSLRSRQSRGPTCACGGSRGSRAPPGTSCSSHRTCRHTHTSARACGRGGTCCRLVATSRSCFPV